MENKKFPKLLKAISTPVATTISIAIAVIALILVLITTQVEVGDCANDKDGFATVIYDIDTRYSGFAVFYLSADARLTGEMFITPQNGSVPHSVPPGRYIIHQYYVTSEQYEVMREYIGETAGLPIVGLYDQHHERAVRLCAGDEYHILAWAQPN